MQGSNLGVLDHNAVLEMIDSSFTQPANKYIEDMTLEECTSKEIPCVTDFNDNSSKERLTFYAKTTQRTMERLEEECEIKGLKFNDKRPTTEHLIWQGRNEALD